MTIQTINLGNYSNDGTGDDLRTAFSKVNNNFATLSSTVSIANGTNLGSGASVFAQKNLANLEFKSLTSTDSSVSITSTTNTVNLTALTTVENDPSPSLGGDLDLNGHKIWGLGANVESKIYGIDVVILNALLSAVIASDNVNVDMGSFSTPKPYRLDMNGTGNIGFSDSADLQNQLDFGSF